MESGDARAPVTEDGSHRPSVIPTTPARQNDPLSTHSPVTSLRQSWKTCPEYFGEGRPRSTTSARGWHSGDHTKFIILVAVLASSGCMDIGGSHDVTIDHVNIYVGAAPVEYLSGYSWMNSSYTGYKPDLVTVPMSISSNKSR